MNFLSTLVKVLPIRPVYAHCDIPCKVYDPTAAQIAAHTVIRMTDMLKEAGDDMHKVVRLTTVKEEHAEILKREVSVLWSDYFKPEHLEKFPDLHTQVWNILKLASKTKQEIDSEAAAKLLEETQKFAEVFYQSKGLEPLRVVSGFPTEGEIVTHK
jgi:nickel superoxide dismutase